MANLVLVSKVFLDWDYLNKVEEVVTLKKILAKHAFLANIQTYLNILNDNIVKCNCIMCIDIISGNYSSFYDIDTVETINDSRCLLYEYFKKECRKWGVIPPNDKYDKPDLDKLNNLSGWLKSSPESWFYKVSTIEYNIQIKTLYPMLHSFYLILNDEISFEDWFHVEGIGLLP